MAGLLCEQEMPKKKVRMITLLGVFETICMKERRLFLRMRRTQLKGVNLHLFVIYGIGHVCIMLIGIVLCSYDNLILNKYSNLNLSVWRLCHLQLSSRHQNQYIWRHVFCSFSLICLTVVSELSLKVEASLADHIFS